MQYKYFRQTKNQSEIKCITSLNVLRSYHVETPVLEISLYLMNGCWMDDRLGKPSDIGLDVRCAWVVMNEVSEWEIIEPSSNPSWVCYHNLCANIFRRSWIEDTWSLKRIASPPNKKYSKNYMRLMTLMTLFLPLTNSYDQIGTFWMKNNVETGLCTGVMELYSTNDKEFPG